jgi:hypothetical protein
MWTVRPRRVAIVTLPWPSGKGCDSPVIASPQKVWKLDHMVVLHA